MVAIAPSKFVHFNLAKYATLSGVICPPYDVIGVIEYDKLLKRDDYNIVRIELPLAQKKMDRYESAAALWKRWQNQKVLVADKEPSYYAYEQRFAVGTTSFVRRGFFAAMKLETPGKGRIRPHERTFPKHKEDRLKLMRATHANISPIFGIFFDKQKKAQALLNKRMMLKPLTISRDDKGVTHRLWRLDDPESIKTLTGVLAVEDVLIADGHHRYETAWNYSQERLAKERGDKSKKAYRYVMTFLCPLTDPGLVIQPTHRAVKWSAPLDDWKARIEPYYTMQPMNSLMDLIAKLRAPKEAGVLGMVLEGGKLFWLTSKKKGTQMPVVSLHEGILKDIPLENVTFGQDPKDLVLNLQRGECNAVFILPPPEKEAFAQICRAGRLLPQKSTYFYPKLATGLVMRPLDGDVG